MDPILVDLVGTASETWGSDDTDDRVASLQEIVDQYLATEGDDVEVTVVAGDLGTEGATGYYDVASDTIILDTSTVDQDDFESALDSTLHEALHAETYEETGTTYAGNPQDEDPSASSPDDIENLDETNSNPDGPTGYGAMVGDTLVVEAAIDGYPAAHQEIDVEAEALAAELLSQATGGSGAPGVASAGGGSEGGDSSTIVITEPLFEFDFSQP